VRGVILAIYIIYHISRGDIRLSEHTSNWCMVLHVNADLACEASLKHCHITTWSNPKSLKIAIDDRVIQTHTKRKNRRGPPRKP
jgi:hypothetical protein